MLVLSRFACLLSAIVFLNACGGQSRLVEVKDFKIFVESEEPSIKDAMAKLVLRYNQEFGSDVLHIVDNQGDSNSLIRFQESLKEDGNKLGTGQWITTTSFGKAMSLEGEIKTTRVEYGMELAFDAENFKAKADAFDVNSESNQHLYHLFCHEIGHGMQMDHVDDKHSVMYPSIPEKANREIGFAEYFDGARAFMGTSSVSKKSTSGKRFPKFGI